MGVESQPGRGSRFWFEVPVRTIGAVEVSSATEGPSSSATSDLAPSWRTDTSVMVVDDTPTNRLVSTRLLERLGLSVIAVDDGQRAVQLIKEGAAPDLVLMDLQMPVLDGIAATRQIRAWEAAQHLRPMPVVALTAAALPSDRDRCLAAGMNGCLTKPMLMGDLRVALAHWLPATNSVASTTA